VTTQKDRPASRHAVDIDPPFVVVHELRLHDPDAAKFLGSRDPEDVDDVVEGALRLGLRAVAAADTSVNERLIDMKISEMGSRLHDAASATFEKQSAAFEAAWAQKIEHGLSARLDAHRSALDATFRAAFDPASTTSVPEQVSKALAAFHKRVNDEIMETQAKARRELAEVVRGSDDPTHPLTMIRSEIRGLTEAVTKELEASRLAVAGIKVLEDRPKQGFIFQDEIGDRIADLLKMTGDEVVPLGRRPGYTGGADGEIIVNVAKAETAGLDARFAVEVTQEKNLSIDSLKSTLRKSCRDRDALRSIVVVRSCKALAGQPFAFFEGLGAVVVCNPEQDDDSIPLQAALRIVRAQVIAEVRRPSAHRDDVRIEHELEKIKTALDKLARIRGNQVKARTLADDTSSLAESLRVVVTDALQGIDEALAA
jgi:hypothetical protein